MPPIKTETETIIEELEKHFVPGFDFSLDRILLLLEQLGNPHKKLPPVIHIAGTNGKGSTAAFTRALLEESGLSVHVHTSPHLSRWEERFRLAAPGGGKFIEDAFLAKTIRDVAEINKQDKITVFEIITAVAFILFSRYPADACIIEVGLGGRLDATNVIENPSVSIITPISLDHEAFLGNTLEEIANEKAGIIKKNAPVVIGFQESDSVIELFKERARQNNSPIAVLGQDFFVSEKDSGFVYRDDKDQIDLCSPSLLGRHQFANAATAIAGLKAAGFSLSKEASNRAMKTVSWFGRMQPMPKGHLSSLALPGAEIWIDGGHNPAGGLATAHTLQNLENQSSRPLILIIGMINTKNHIDYFRAFCGMAEHVYTVPIPHNPQSVPALELALQAQKAGLCAEPADSVSQALAQIAKTWPKEKKPPRILIGGSLYLIGSILEENETLPI